MKAACFTFLTVGFGVLMAMLIQASPASIQYGARSAISGIDQVLESRMLRAASHCATPLKVFSAAAPSRQGSYIALLPPLRKNSHVDKPTTGGAFINIKIGDASSTNRLKAYATTQGGYSEGSVDLLNSIAFNGSDNPDKGRGKDIERLVFPDEHVTDQSKFAPYEYCVSSFTEAGLELKTEWRRISLKPETADEFRLKMIELMDDFEHEKYDMKKEADVKSLSDRMIKLFKEYALEKPK
ncbi:hypothetical protein FISHEDRAFT_56416 [Fistulina hepatica ATCC 64428]|uniref:Uncharacterized protein n=1 Tax=Fistulina hepatica ATCC 64428 TaxID=1128425 RepID=A0A0D7AJJ1_9AGAR|nr:hypothetical protein FISHEDRAFT_56416 [Fistulina hepatica ATCC 64428]